MSDILKAAVVLGAAIVVAVLLAAYFSPYHSCVRAATGEAEPSLRALVCARAVGGNSR